MPKENITGSLISSRLTSTIYGIGILATGLSYFRYAKLITPLLPVFLPKTNLWSYLMGAAFILAALAIFMNRQITVKACYLLTVLLFFVTVVIDLRGLFNLPDEFKNLYLQSFFKDIGMMAGAMMIANFEREHKHRRGRHRIKSSSELKSK